MPSSKKCGFYLSRSIDLLGIIGTCGFFIFVCNLVTGMDPIVVFFCTRHGDDVVSVLI